MPTVSFNRTRGINLIEIGLESIGDMKMSEDDLDNLLDGLWSEWSRLFDSVYRSATTSEPQEFTHEQTVDCDGLISFGRKVKLTVRVVSDSFTLDEFTRAVTNLEGSIATIQVWGQSPLPSARDFKLKLVERLTRERPEIPLLRELKSMRLSNEDLDYIIPVLPGEDNPYPFGQSD